GGVDAAPEKLPANWFMARGQG
ncbi:hypothetical protein A2U01_0084216, partial [Trifolium medium]|nr:hypothetical protein [Trifolium medium]